MNRNTGLMAVALLVPFFHAFAKDSLPIKQGGYRSDSCANSFLAGSVYYTGQYLSFPEVNSKLESVMHDGNVYTLKQSDIDVSVVTDDPVKDAKWTEHHVFKVVVQSPTEFTTSIIDGPGKNDSKPMTYRLCHPHH